MTSAVPILSGGLTVRQRLVWAGVFALFGPTVLALRKERYGWAPAWWAYVLVGLASAAFAFVAIQWRLGDYPEKAPEPPERPDRE